MSLSIEITYYQPAEMKTGGAYISAVGIVKKIDRYEKTVVMRDETRIPIENIIRITGDIFQSIDDFFE